MEITVPLDRFESAEQYVSSNVSTRLALLRDSDVAVGVGPVRGSDDEDSSEGSNGRRVSRSLWSWLGGGIPVPRRCKSSYFPLNYGSANLCRGHPTSLNACSRVLLADPRTAIGGMPGHDGVNNRAAESTDPVLDIKQFILPHIKHFIPIVQRHIAHKVTLPTLNHKLYIYTRHPS